MSGPWSDLRRVASSSGVYAAAAIAQRGLAFFLLPVYTRFIDPAEYGVLELLSAFSSVLFGVLMMGLPSAITKSYHRDCRDERDRRGILATALALELPVLILGAAGLWFAAPALAGALTGDPAGADLLRLVAATGFLTSVTALILASLRAQERAVAFSVLSLAQFAAALTLNLVLVVKFGLGVRGVLWGNLLSNVIALPLAVAVVVRGGATLEFCRRLVAPLARFGALLVPVMLSGWIINLSDRYVLKAFSALEEVAIYGVGYKLGMIVELTLVWPFQLAWPAVSFSISHHEGHRVTFARILTYLAALLAFMIVALSLLSRVGLLVLVGEGYREAYRVVPWIALAYALNGVQYCVAPGLHLSERTRYLTWISMIAAAVNLGLNFLLIPRHGMMGAAWATVIAFLLTAAVTMAAARRWYAVPFEVGRLVKIVAAALVVFALGAAVTPALTAWSIGWHLAFGLLAFPAALVALRLLGDDEKAALATALGRLREAARWPPRPSRGAKP